MKIRNRINIEKKKYICIISFITISMLLGFFFYIIISKSNKDLVTSIQTNYFNSSLYKEYLNNLIRSFITNSIYISIIFILGFSVFGSIFNIGILFFKSFIFGFSISSLIGSFGFKGLLLSLIYLFPHQILFLVILLLISYYSMNMSSKIFRSLFIRNITNIKVFVYKYIKVFLICIFSSLILSLYEVFICNNLLNMII